MQTLDGRIKNKVRRIKGIEDTQSILVIVSERDMSSTSLDSYL